MATYKSYKDFRYRRRNHYIDGGPLGKKNPKGYCWCERHKGYLSAQMIKEHKCEKRQCSFFEDLVAKRNSQPQGASPFSSEKEKVKFELKNARESERIYAFDNEYLANAGCFGILRAEFNDKGSFVYDWEKIGDEENAADECSNLIGALRTGSHTYDFLSSRKALMNFCQSRKDHAFNRDGGSADWALRIKTAENIYMMRLHPSRDQHNAVCFCYNKEMFLANIRSLKSMNFDGSVESAAQ